MGTAMPSPSGGAGSRASERSGGAGVGATRGDRLRRRRAGERADGAVEAPAAEGNVATGNARWKNVAMFFLLMKE
jgi:hypothetical protein